MKLNLFCACCLLVLTGSFLVESFEAGGVIIVSRKDVSAFEEVKNSFIQQSFVEQVPGLNTKAYYLDGSSPDAAVLKEVSEVKPDAVFAIGAFSAKKVREVLPDVPIVTAMVYYPETDGLNLDPKTVVVNSLGSAKELAIEVKSFRKIKTIGLIRFASISSSAEIISSELKSQGLEVLDFPVAKQEDVAPIFEAAKGRIQAILILPDPITQNPDTLRFIVTQSVTNDILPIALNENMVASGAFFAVFYSTDSIGQKVAKTLRELLRLQKIPDIRLQNPETTSSALNKGSMQAFKLKIPSNLKIGVIYE